MVSLQDNGSQQTSLSTKGDHAFNLQFEKCKDSKTLLGRYFAKRDLSVGQWQKLALARGLARTDARLLILDEPSASLDARAEYELFSHFRQAAQGRTTLLISHRFSTISMADRILVLEKGRLVECGRHEELLAQAGHYATLYHLHRQQIGETA